jgi:nucleolar protein 58
MEGKPIKPRGVNIAPNGAAQPQKFDLKEARKYNPDADALAEVEEPTSAKKSKKDKKKLVEDVEEDEEMEDAGSDDEAEAEANGSADSELEKLAAKAGLSVKRYQRKLERGEITFDAAGNPTSVSKKDLKKAKKEAKKADKEDGKKRKRDDGDDSEKKKKKKSKGE